MGVLGGWALSCERITPVKDIKHLVGKELYSKRLIQSKSLNECFDNTNKDHYLRCISVAERFKSNFFSYETPRPACPWLTGLGYALSVYSRCCIRICSAIVGGLLRHLPPSLPITGACSHPAEHPTSKRCGNESTTQRFCDYLCEPLE